MEKKKSLCIRIPDREIKLMDIILKTTSTIPSPIINTEENNCLKKYKNKIDETQNNKYWDSVKKITNDYELIHIPSNKKKK